MIQTPQVIENSVRELVTAYVEKHAPSSFLLAYSGGLDSSVLLHLFVGLRRDFPHIELKAIHVHHGLQQAADQWLVHCQAQCTQWSVPLIVKYVDAQARHGESPEAAARFARYGAIEEVLQSGAFLLLAQHQDDQAETFLLQLMRGAGPKGLSAMPVFSIWGAAFKCRPLLGFSRAELDAYAYAHDLNWVEDPSNQSTDYDRNYLRHKVLPLLKERWSGIDQVISRSARLCAESDALIEELAAGDLEIAGDGRNSLDIASLLSLSPARRKNLIRYWIKQQGAPLPGYQALNRINDELLFARSDAQPKIDWHQYEARRYRNRLYVLNCEPVLPELDVPWDIRHKLPIPGLGILQADLGAGPGLSLKKLGGRALSVRFRQGGESIRPKGDSHTRPLQKLLQREAVPPWARERIPLVFADNELVAVVGFCYADAFHGEKNDINLHIKLIDNFQIE